MDEEVYGAADGNGDRGAEGEWEIDAASEQETALQTEWGGNMPAEMVTVFLLGPLAVALIRSKKKKTAFHKTTTDGLLERVARYVQVYTNRSLLVRPIYRGCLGLLRSTFFLVKQV